MFSSNLSLRAIIKITQKCLWRSQFSSKEGLFSYISRIFVSVVKQVCYVIAFAELCLFMEECSENVIEYFIQNKNGRAKCVSIQIFLNF